MKVLFATSTDLEGDFLVAAFQSTSEDLKKGIVFWKGCVFLHSSMFFHLFEMSLSRIKGVA